MTNDERDVMIRETHDSVIRMEDKVTSHHTTLYGNGKKGVVLDVAGLVVFRAVSCWMAAAVSVASIGVIAKLVYGHITG
jgi:hypothetical protein